jgi:regulator of cell morphogenesis and NO signaling
MESAFPLNQILQRYTLSSDKNLRHPFEVLRSLKIDQRFIHTLLRTFENEKSFCESEYREFSLEIIIDYIKRTHQYYRNKKLEEIDQSIQILLKDYSANHPLLNVLNNFFSGYKTELTNHIGAEENQLLPYIQSLLKCEQEEFNLTAYFELTKNYNIQTFIANHHDTEESLSTVKETILHYKAPFTNQTPYRILLTQLDAFEKDLAVHAIIEDFVLIPRALKLEKKFNCIFSKKLLLN